MTAANTLKGGVMGALEERLEDLGVIEPEQMKCFGDACIKCLRFF